MALNSNQQWVRHSLTYSVRNLRMIDRTQLHGVKTMQSASAAFEIFEGVSPDYYSVSGWPANYAGFTNYFNSNFQKVAVPAFASGSILLYENGALHKGPVPSGTVLLDPRSYWNKGFPVDFNHPKVDPTYVVSGEITIRIDSGQIQNFIF